MSDAWNGKCPNCNNVNAYQGFNSWECPNSNCKFFTAKQRDEVQAEKQKQREIEQEYLQAQNQLAGCDEEDMNFDCAEQSQIEEYNRVIDDLYGAWASGYISTHNSGSQKTAANQQKKAKTVNKSQNDDDDDSYFYAF